MSVCSALAFGLPGYQELLVILLVGLLVFGRRLPEVGKTLGKTVAQVRRGMQDFRAQLDRDESLRDVRDTMRDLKQISDAPRVLANPTRWLDLEQEPPPPSQQVAAPAADASPAPSPGAAGQTPAAPPAAEARAPAPPSP